MDNLDNKVDNLDLYSKIVKAGKRTYFFDVKSTKSDDLYITITESKRKFDNVTGQFSYDKHKIFIYKEDFENFLQGIKDSIRFIETGEKHIEPDNDTEKEEN